MHSLLPSSSGDACSCSGSCCAYAAPRALLAEVGVAGAEVKACRTEGEEVCDEQYGLWGGRVGDKVQPPIVHGVSVRLFSNLAQSSPKDSDFKFRKFEL